MQESSKPPESSAQDATPRSSGGLEYFVIGVVMSLGVGVPITLFSIYFFADNVTTLAVAFLCMIGVVVAAGTLLVVFRARLLRSISGVTTRSLNSVTEPGLTAIRAVAQREPEIAVRHGEEAARRLAAWFSWITMRRWVLGLVIGLVAAFAGFVGTALLFQQNKLITKQNGLIGEQNAFLREQTTQLRHQIDADEEERLLVRRAEFLDTLYACEEGSEAADPCEPAAPPQVRHAALTAFVGLERAYQKRAWEQRSEAGTTQRDAPRRPDLAGVNLIGVNLDGESLRGVDLRGAYFNETELRRVDFTDANLTDARIRGAEADHADFRRSTLTGTLLSKSDLSEANFSNATLEETDLRNATLVGADFSGANLKQAFLQGADLTDADLTDADLTNARYSNKTRWPEGFDPKARGAQLAF